MSATTEQIDAGQAIYTKHTLAAYDWLVLGMSGKLVWKCPSSLLEAHYSKYITANHLDVGVGTGYFPDRCQFPSPNPRIALMDLNRHSLDFASARIARYCPETYRRNVLEPIVINAGKFDSVAINLLLHCLPGSISTKSVAFDNLKELMNPGAVLFGTTLLYDGVPSGWLAKRLMNVYNSKGIFSNRHDDIEGLKRELSKRFSDVTLEIAGSAAIFSGRA